MAAALKLISHKLCPYVQRAVIALTEHLAETSVTGTARRVVSGVRSRVRGRTDRDG